MRLSILGEGEENVSPPNSLRCVCYLFGFRDFRRVVCSVLVCTLEASLKHASGSWRIRILHLDPGFGRAGLALSASSSSVDGLWPKFFSSAKFPSMFSIGDEHHEYCLLFGYLSAECSSHHFCDQDSKCLFWTWFLLLHLRLTTVHTRASAGFLRTFGRYVLKNMRTCCWGSLR